MKNETMRLKTMKLKTMKLKTMRIKKMIAALTAVCMMAGTSTSVFAADNTFWQNYDYSKYTNNWTSGSSSSGSTNSWSLGSGWENGSSLGSGSSWNLGSGWNWGGNNKPATGGSGVIQEDASLAAPKIGECRYIHQTLNAPDCLTVAWSDVQGAVSYEMEMCSSDCSVIATYKLENSRFFVPANRNDKNVTGCCRGRKIRVRAIDQNGNPGKWSEYNTVGCNSIRG